MDYQTLQFDIQDDIAVLTLNRPESKNALNSQMRAEIAHAAGQAGRDARVLASTGAGGAFCSGQDLGSGRNAARIDLQRTLRDEYMPMLRAMVECPIPIIAAVNGVAAGAGANLALATDVVIAAESAVFLQPFVRLGLIPGAGGTYWPPRQMGLARAMGSALFAEPIPARQACDWGLIWEAVPDTEFADRWRERAETLARGPTVAYGHLKEAMRAGSGNSLEEQLALEARLQGACGQTRDFQEGVIAFMEKRPPRFEGR